MSYCVFADVRAIVDTDVTDAEITDLITGIQAFQDILLTGGGPNATIRKEICRRWTAITCMLKDPDAASLGEWRESRGVALKKLNEELKALIRIAYGGISFQAPYEPLV